MVRILSDVAPYMDFITRINNDPDFSDPMLRTPEEIQGNLLRAAARRDHHAFGIFDGEVLTGLFFFLILPEENYLEMLAGLSKSSSAYEEMWAWLAREYAGCLIDFVYNPNNTILHAVLAAHRAEFEREQQKMRWKREIPCHSIHQIRQYAPKYEEGYRAIHTTGGYWTAEKVIAAPDRFRILLALDRDTVVGYLDVTYTFAENEPFDLFVLPDHRRKGYAKALLAEAIARNKPRQMALLVYVDNVPAIALYESLGFEKVPGENSITAHARL